MNINTNRKREYIQITSHILETEGPEGIKIRRIAEAAGCTSAVLYKHFQNLDHLVMLASVKFLEPYITKFREVTRRKDISSVQMDLILWRFFIREAFSKKPYYEMMFFCSRQEQLEDYVYEYYQLFPEEVKEFDGFGASIIFSNNLREREYIRLRRAANAGALTMDDADLLSRLATAVFKGMFVEYPYEPGKSDHLEAAAEECYQLILELFKKFVKPETILDVE